MRNTSKLLLASAIFSLALTSSSMATSTFDTSEVISTHVVLPSSEDQVGSPIDLLPTYNELANCIAKQMTSGFFNNQDTISSVERICQIFWAGKNVRPNIELNIIACDLSCNVFMAKPGLPESDLAKEIIDYWTGRGSHGSWFAIYPEALKTSKNI